ncbi:nuclear transport factor 2 family protein [Ideonella oryzae]|uniref:Nuclear transport factor 2 family protein n=1 Tax=Ideonella oryzae TaxID=2937441 RepID=A0ABT1BR85_9BURK|nr:nuclear transport factor 2 family protein [Ideonella oryzae]MCO5978729.1 nuclear transport factor 2 family protein [Ideonella oryzae]
MSHLSYTAFAPVKPYFDLVRDALGDLVDGPHFFDCTAPDIRYEVLYKFPGWPPMIQGRAALMASFEGYGEHIVIHRADQLVRHLADGGKTLIIEYAVHGTILSTGNRYDNRFCSIIHLVDRKIIHWRDYMDSLAAWNALATTSQ